jgi:RimJ/RimL family protein N-acetyltransferase
MASPKPIVYSIETERLLIRCWEPRDAPLFNAAQHASWEHLGPWMPWAHGQPPAVEVTTALLRRWRGGFDLDQDYVYGIFNLDDTLCLGSTGLHTRRGSDVREIGYWIHVDHINQGYATEASAALTRIAFEISGMRRLEIHCLTDNVRSAAVPRKLGYTHEATRRAYLDVAEDDYRDAMIWTLLASEYPGSPASQIALTAYDVMGKQINP